MTPSSKNIGPIRNTSGPPSLIQEENEEDTSFHSVATDMYDFIVPETEPIVVSQIPPTVRRPRIVRRMMARGMQDTVLSLEDYTTDRIVNKSRPLFQQPNPSEAERIKQMRNILRVPSFAFNHFLTLQQRKQKLLKEPNFFDKIYLFERSHYQQVYI